jgi:hypothetical protein
MTQWHDPIVAEVRQIREQQAAELDYDLKAIFERARRRQQQSKRKTVSFANHGSPSWAAGLVLRVRFQGGT